MMQNAFCIFFFSMESAIYISSFSMNSARRTITGVDAACKKCIPLSIKQDAIRFPLLIDTGKYEHVNVISRKYVFAHEKNYIF